MMIPVIDMHCDTISAIKAAEDAKGGCGQGVRSLARPETTSLRSNKMAIDLLRMREGGYMCQSFALYTNLDTVKAQGKTPFQYAMELSDVFDREMQENADLIRPVKRAAEIRENHEKGLLSALKTVEEGAVYEGDIKKLEAFYQKGVRKSTLTWNYKNELGFPNPSEYDENQQEYVCVNTDLVNGLTKTGFAFVEAMEAMGILIDISHLNDAGIRDVFEVVRKDTPVIASHSNARGASFHPRNLSDEMIKSLAEHGGVCGINFGSQFLNERYIGVKEEQDCLSRIEDMLCHIKYIQKVGGIDVIGLGTDFDGVGGRLEISGAGEMQKLADAMSLAGFRTDEIEKVFYRNVLRVYETVLK